MGQARKKNRRRVEKITILVTLLLLLATTAGWLVLDGFAVVVELAFYATFILLALYQIYSKLRQQMETNYRESEALLSLFATIRPDRPLPDTRKWAASAGFLKKLAELILRMRPTLVVETGSGVSTIVIAYCLRRVGKGKLISLEHDAAYADASRSLVAWHGLEETATVVHASLRPIEIAGNEWLWYDMSCVTIDRPIELLVVDGPPEAVQPLARYPALPLFFRHLHDRSCVLLDDADRKDEKKIVALWEKDYADITCEHFDVEKGAVLIRKNKTPSSRADIRVAEIRSDTGRRSSVENVTPQGDIAG